MELDRREYERRYLARLHVVMANGIATDKYAITLDRIDVHEEKARSWAYVMFRVASMPGCAFARAGLVWPGHPTDDDPGWIAELFKVHLYEILEAGGWGLPPHCEPSTVTWLHPFRRPPWEQFNEEEPERRDWEQRFLARVEERLADSALDGAQVERLELRGRCGQTHALLTFRVPDRPGCTFATHIMMWVGWPTPWTAEARADNFHDRFLRLLQRLPEPCAAEGLTWGGRAPHWFEGSHPRG